MTVRFDFQGEAVTPRDAATVLVLREGRGAPEVFFVKRNAGARFMGGAYVFPGGRVDAHDADEDIPCDLTPDEAARRLGGEAPSVARALHVAALRECLEESGLLLSVAAAEADVVAALRKALEGREVPPLGPLLRAHGVTLAARALVPLSRWVTPRAETRRFDARFFLARAPLRTDDATHDGQETVDSAWLTPADALARAARKEIVLAPPTWRTLDLLADARTVDEALASAPAAIAPVEPDVVLVDGAPCVVLPEAGEKATRFFYDDGAWTPSR